MISTIPSHRLALCALLPTVVSSCERATFQCDCERESISHREYQETIASGVWLPHMQAVRSGRIGRIWRSRCGRVTLQQAAIRTGRQSSLQPHSAARVQFDALTLGP